MQFPPDQESGQRRLSWKGIKTFVKNTKRRSVQQFISKSQTDITIAPEEQAFMDKKQQFKEFNQTVIKIRKHLIDLQIAITKLSSSITTLTDDEILLPAQGTEELQVTKNRLDTLGIANTDKGQRLIGLIEEQNASIKEKLVMLANIKKMITERDNLKTDVESYERRLEAANIKNAQKPSAKTAKDVEKLQAKLTRSRDMFAAKNEEALSNLDSMESQRGVYLQTELQSIHKLSAEYFSALANGYSMQSPKSMGAQMMSNATNAFNAGKTQAAKAAKEAKNNANNVANTAKTAAAFGAMSMATSSSNVGGNPFMRKSSSNDSVPPPKKRPSVGGKSLTPGSYVTATHDFVPEEDDELEFKKDDRLMILEVVGPGWLVSNVYVPSPNTVYYISLT
eukprot:g6409.t1